MCVCVCVYVYLRSRSRSACGVLPHLLPERYWAGGVSSHVACIFFSFFFFGARGLDSTRLNLTYRARADGSMWYGVVACGIGRTVAGLVEDWDKDKVEKEEAEKGGDGGEKDQSADTVFEHKYCILSCIRG